MIGQRLTDSDIVISSRISLSRNIAEFPFVCTCSTEQLTEIETTILDRLNGLPKFENVSFDETLPVTTERQLLAEIESLGHCGAMGHSFSTSELSLQSAAEGDLRHGEKVIRINDEDHFQISVTRHDGDLAAAWQSVSELDDLVEEHFSFAFHQRWGYLTTSPADLGTGMRLSVTMFLPGLAATDQTDKLFRTLHQKNLIARNTLGVSSSAFDNVPVGSPLNEQALDMFKVSNLNTLGMTEADLIEQVEEALPPIIGIEREAREIVLAQPQSVVERQVNVAVEEICRLSLEGGADRRLTNLLLSRIRFGAGVGLVSQEATQRVLHCYSLAHQREQLGKAIRSEDYVLAAELRDKIGYLEEQLNSQQGDGGSQ